MLYSFQVSPPDLEWIFGTCYSAIFPVYFAGEDAPAAGIDRE